MHKIKRKNSKVSFWTIFTLAITVERKLKDKLGVCCAPLLPDASWRETRTPWESPFFPKSRKKHAKAPEWEKIYKKIPRSLLHLLRILNAEISSSIRGIRELNIRTMAGVHATQHIGAFRVRFTRVKCQFFLYFSLADCGKKYALLN